MLSPYFVVLADHVESLLRFCSPLFSKTTWLMSTCTSPASGSCEIRRDVGSLRDVIKNVFECFHRQEADGPIEKAESPPNVPSPSQRQVYPSSYTLPVIGKVDVVRQLVHFGAPVPVIASTL